MPSVSMVVMAWLMVGSGRSAPSPKGDSRELFLESPVPEGRAWTLKLIGGKVFLEDTRFSDPQEQGNSLADDRTGRSRRPPAPKPFSMVVPVARNISSFKELFEILREDQVKPQRGLASARNLTYAKGSESKNSVVFSDPQEQGNSLADDRTGRSRRPPAPKPFSMVVPVARNFSSYQELFEILREDQVKPQGGLASARNLTYVKGSESKNFVVLLTN